MIALSALDKPRVGNITESRPFLPDRQRDCACEKVKSAITHGQTVRKRVAKLSPIYTIPIGRSDWGQVPQTNSGDPIFGIRTENNCAHNPRHISESENCHSTIREKTLVVIDNGNAKFDQCINLSARQPSASNKKVLIN